MWILVRADIFNYRGKCLFMMGFFMEALMDYSLAIKLEKDEKQHCDKMRLTGTEVQRQTAASYKC